MSSRFLLFHTLVILCDNLSATYLAVNPVLHSRTKHVEIDFHFVHDRVLQWSLIVQLVSLLIH